MNAKLGLSEPPGQDPSPPTRRVVAVVELLAKHADTPLTLAEICRELGISRSTGHAILHTLRSSDWISRDPVSGRFTLGPGLPATSAPSAPMPRILREPLQKLCTDLGMAVCISEVRGGSIAVIDATAPARERPHVPAGVRLPFVAPFGREFVAWAPPRASQEWFDAAGAANDAYRARMPQILAEIRTRGYGIERLTDPLLRVYAALLALDNGNVPDPVSMRLAGAVADLTIVDVLPSELADIEAYSLATISAPIFDERGVVVMSVSAQPYRTLSAKQVRAVGTRVMEFADTATALVAQHAEN
jgi:DNA-binding IclR family transcriptional regulator